jgi:hypothetical protein
MARAIGARLERPVYCGPGWGKFTQLLRLAGVYVGKTPARDGSTAVDRYRSRRRFGGAAQADPEAFGALYERYVKKIYSYLYYRTGNTHDAEDLTERVFQKAMMNLHRYTSRGLPFSAWLYRIAHNLLANWHRDRGRRQTIAFNELAPGDLTSPEARRPKRWWNRGRSKKRSCRPSGGCQRSASRC